MDNQPRNGQNLSLGTLLKELTNAYARAIDTRMGAIGLTKVQSDVLFQLYQNPNLTQREICRINNVTEATLSVVINGLVRKHLIRRERNISDPRKKKLVLTEKAHHLRPDVLRIKADAYHALVAGLSQVHLERLTEDLRQLLDNLERIK